MPHCCPTTRDAFLEAHSKAMCSDAHGGSHSPLNQIVHVQAALNELSARGALVVASAGNDGQDTDTTPHYPSSLPDDVILSVGAATRQNALW